MAQGAVSVAQTLPTARVPVRPRARPAVLPGAWIHVAHIMSGAVRLVGGEARGEIAARGRPCSLTQRAPRGPPPCGHVRGLPPSQWALCEQTKYVEHTGRWAPPSGWAHLTRWSPLTLSLLCTPLGVVVLSPSRPRLYLSCMYPQMRHHSPGSRFWLVRWTVTCGRNAWCICCRCGGCFPRLPARVTLPCRA